MPDQSVNSVVSESVDQDIAAAIAYWSFCEVIFSLRFQVKLQVDISSAWRSEYSEIIRQIQLVASLANLLYILIHSKEHLNLELDKHGKTYSKDWAP